MREIETIYATDISSLQIRLRAVADDKSRCFAPYKNNLRWLFQSKPFQKKARAMRGKFSIPAYGWKTANIPKVTDALNSKEKSTNKKRFLAEMSLMYSQAELKAMRINTKSRKTAFEHDVKALRLEEKLPFPFQKLIEFYILHDIWSSKLLPPGCIVRVFDDDGEKRVFLEIFGNTSVKDIKKAWGLIGIKQIKKRLQLPGQQLSDHDNYYRAKYVDKKGPEIDDDALKIMRFRRKQADRRYGYTK